MASDKSGPRSAVEGIVEGVKGKTKEIVGDVTDNEDLEREGEAQVEKGRAQRDAAKHEAKAEASRAKAEGHEAEQRLHQ